MHSLGEEGWGFPPSSLPFPRTKHSLPGLTGPITLSNPPGARPQQSRCLLCSSLEEMVGHPTTPRQTQGGLGGGRRLVGEAWSPARLCALPGAKPGTWPSPPEGSLAFLLLTPSSCKRLEHNPRGKLAAYTVQPQSPGEPDAWAHWRAHWPHRQGPGGAAVRPTPCLIGERCCSLMAATTQRR